MLKNMVYYAISICNTGGRFVMSKEVKLVRCLVCGEIFDAAEGRCPVCGVGLDQCEPV